MIMTPCARLHSFFHPEELVLDEARRRLLVRERDASVRVVTVDSSGQRRAERRAPLVTLHRLLHAAPARSRASPRDDQPTEWWRPGGARDARVRAAVRFVFVRAGWRPFALVVRLLIA